ncbi:Ig-like domain-containing protein [Mycobacterium sp. M26]|uniref:Ig-like domain-containing protein n=1 Tax=Mycobacterium sp. M26 TaxID=1762962 RepID=UPI001E4036E9|nr:Ig-like domain-containing protein [Mycobacterium sp. M26]
MVSKSTTASAAATTTASAATTTTEAHGTSLRSALLAATPSASSVPAALTAQATTPDPIVVINNAITQLLNPFLNPPPTTPGPIVPMVWAFMGWVRRDLFNQAPTMTYDSNTTVQTGQTLSGKLGATDAEGDALTYTVTQGPQYGTLTIDQSTGDFTYTPNNIDYTAVQTDSFSVSVTDGKFNILMPFSSHSATTTDDLSVLNPTIQRVILDMPAGVVNPKTPRFSADGSTILFAATPSAGGRQEIYQINTDGTDVICLTCGVATTITNNFLKPVPFADGSGRILFQSVPTVGNYTHVIYENGINGAQIVPVVTPASGTLAIDKQREMRPSPDGTHVVFTQIQAVGNPSNPYNAGIYAVPIVGTLTRTTNATTGAAEYQITDARVIYPTGEAKQWTPDGKGVVILGGTYEQGNVDDIVVDLATGKVSRVTANLEYDEDMDYSPNQQWIAIGSTRGGTYNALSPIDRIVRPAFLPAYIQGTVYQAYATPINVSNQEWIVSQADELKGIDGIPLFVNGDGWNARSMPSWSTDGSAVTFWETALADQTQSRLVVANLKYTTSVGGVVGDNLTPDQANWNWSESPWSPSGAPLLSSYVPSAPPLPATGTYTSTAGGTAVVTEDSTTTPGHTVRTVVYTDYVNEDGMVINGTESTDTYSKGNLINYNVNLTVTGSHTGSLTGTNVVIDKIQRKITGGSVTSILDGDTQHLLDPAVITAAQQGV